MRVVGKRRKHAFSLIMLQRSIPPDGAMANVFIAFFQHRLLAPLVSDSRKTKNDPRRRSAVGGDDCGGPDPQSYSSLRVQSSSRNKRRRTSRPLACHLQGLGAGLGGQGFGRTWQGGVLGLQSLRLLPPLLLPPPRLLSWSLQSLPLL